MSTKESDYAVVFDGGRQHIISVGGKVELDREGATTADKVLMVKTRDKIQIGTPYLKSAKAELSFAGVKKAGKVVSFKKKRRKGYRRKIGHRQKYFVYEVKNIIPGTEA